MATQWGFQRKRLAAGPPAASSVATGQGDEFDG